MIAGYAVDKFQAKYMMSLALFGNALAMLGSAALCAHASFSAWPLYLIGFTNGVAIGIFGLVNSIIYANWFGRTHLGQIQGVSQSLIVLGSAVGPAVISVGHDLWGNYATVLKMSALAPITCGIAILYVSKPRKRKDYAEL